MSKKILLYTAIPTTILLTLLGVFLIEKCVEEPYEKRIGVLEQEVSILQKYNNDTTGRQISLKELAIKIEANTQEIKNTDAKLRSDYNLFFQAGLPITILGLLGFLVGLYFRVFNVAVDEAKKEIARQLNSEESLKLEKRISILTKQGADNSFLDKFFRRMGFENYKYYKYNAKNDNYLDCDMLFLYNDFSKDTDSYFNEEERSLIFEKLKNQKIIFHYFGSADLSNEMRMHPQCTSTNFKSQLYGNIISALKYQKLL